MDDITNKINKLLADLRLMNEIMRAETSRGRDWSQVLSEPIYNTETRIGGFKIIGFGYDPFIHKYCWKVEHLKTGKIFTAESDNNDPPTELGLWKEWTKKRKQNNVPGKPGNDC